MALAEDAAQRITALESRAEHLGGLGELLARTEAVASSKIEHIYAEMDDIARATIGEAAGDKARRTVAAGLALTETDGLVQRRRSPDRGRDPLGAPPVGYVAGSAIAAAEASVESADRLAELPARWSDAVRACRGSSARTLVEGLLKNPILDIHRASGVTGSTKIRTYEALDRLQAAGVLDEITGSGRNRIWVAGDVMTELRALEERIGRRSRPSQDRTRLS